MPIHLQDVCCSVLEWRIVRSHRFLLDNIGKLPLSNTGRLVLKKTVFFCVGEYAEYEFDTKVDMVCFSPVGYGV